jgi:secernin
MKQIRVAQPDEFGRGAPMVTVLGCDTGVALPDVTQSGYTILGKNSDRRISESQRLELHLGQSFEANTLLQLEHRNIPQVRQTYSTLGAGPYWCWGYEEGMNEYCVAIGNEAIHTKTNREGAIAYRAGRLPEPGLLGMDIVRLALERSKSAAEAVAWIGRLVEKHGQFGSSYVGEDNSHGYDNSYMVADTTEAWVVETYGKHWTALRLLKGSWAISNEPCITTKWDASDSAVISYAVEKGWWPADRAGEFNAALAYTNFHFPAELSYSRARRFRQLLVEGGGSIDTAWFKRILRDHYENTFRADATFNPTTPGLTTICMHASPSGSTWGHTASSAIFVLPPVNSGKLPVMWWCAGPPCNGLFVPVFLQGNQLPAMVDCVGTAGKKVIAPNRAILDEYSPDSYWWEFKRLSDITKGDEIGSTWNQRHPMVKETFNRLENKFVENIAVVEREVGILMEKQDMQSVELILSSFTESCFKESMDTVRYLQREIVQHGKAISISLD